MRAHICVRARVQNGIVLYVGNVTLAFPWKRLVLKQGNVRSAATRNSRKKGW